MQAANTAAADDANSIDALQATPGDETLDPARSPSDRASTETSAECNDLAPETLGDQDREEGKEKDEKDEKQSCETAEATETAEPTRETVDTVDTVDVDRPIPAVQICVRVRPMLQWEKAEGYEPSAMELKEDIDGTVALKEDGRHRHFRFNAVIGGERTQQEVWDMSRIDAVVKKVALGFHATVFAYGQTGTGKTHTMEGYTYEHHCGMAPTVAAARPRVKAKATRPEQLGIVPRAVMALFERVEAMKADAMASTASGATAGALAASTSSGSTSCVVRLSFLQIYNEKIFDLLNPSITVSQREVGGRGDEFSGLRLRWDAAKRNFFVENLFQYECSSAEEALQHYQQGIQNKQVASTTMNVASSRSHTLLVLTLLRREGEKSEDGGDGGGTTPGRPCRRRPCQEVVSQLSLVDLAGSERSVANVANVLSGFGREAKGSTRFQEAVNVNQSLFVLRRVITALSKREANPREAFVHIPYRESKLTSLLQNSLGGNSYLVMFACLAPSERQDDENLSTLQYASQAACIRNQPVVNLDPKDQMIQQLEARLAAAHDYLRRVLQLSELPEDLLEEERRAAGASGPGPRRPRPPRFRARTHPKPTSGTGGNGGNGNIPGNGDGSAGTGNAAGAAYGAVASRQNLAARAKTWTGTEQRWGFQDEGSDSRERSEQKAKGQEMVSESSRESSKSRAKPKKVSGHEANSATSTLNRIVQGAAQKSPSCDDWPFATRSKSDSAEGKELFAAVDAMMRGYDGPKPSPRKPKPRPASLPPVVPEGPTQWPPKPPKDPKASTFGRDGRESPAASVQSAETALDSVAGSKCSCCGSDRTPQTDAAQLLGYLKVKLEQADAAEKSSEAMEEALSELHKARDVQRRLEEELLAAHGKIQDLEVSQSKLGEEREEKATLQNLQSENAELHRRLEVFYKAMEFEEGPDADPMEQEELTPQGALAMIAPEAPETGSVASIGQKIEKFHSQLVLEAVTLRNEVARLKKKKWIIKAVLDNGGEQERQAIVEEVAMLRSKREADSPSSAT